MNTAQTDALLADFDHPDLTEHALAARHGLTLDELAAHAARPAFRRALALLRTLRDLRRPLQIARAQAQAAQILTKLTERDPTSATAAKEVRLAVKALLALITDPDASSPGAGGFQPPVPQTADAPNPGTQTPAATACSQAVPAPSHPQPNPTPPPEPASESGAAAAPAPTPQTNRTNSTQPSARTAPHKPKRPRGTKPRPKARSR